MRKTPHRRSHLQDDSGLGESLKFSIAVGNGSEPGPGGIELNELRAVKLRRNEPGCRPATGLVPLAWSEAGREQLPASRATAALGQLD